MNAVAPMAGVFRDRVRWSDVDAAGIVCFGRYLRFFEGAEEELFRSADLPPDALPRDHGVWLVRRRVSAEFTRPVQLGDEIETVAQIGRLGRTSIQLCFSATVNGQQVATGEYILVCVDRDGLFPRPLPPGVRNRLAQHADAG